MHISTKVVMPNITAFEIFLANLNDMLGGWCRCDCRQQTTVFVSSGVVLTQTIPVFNYLSLFVVAVFGGVMGVEQGVRKGIRYAKECFKYAQESVGNVLRTENRVTT